MSEPVAGFGHAGFAHVDWGRAVRAVVPTEAVEPKGMPQVRSFDLSRAAAVKYLTWANALVRSAGLNHAFVDTATLSNVFTGFRALMETGRFSMPFTVLNATGLPPKNLFGFAEEYMRIVAGERSGLPDTFDSGEVPSLRGTAIKLVDVDPKTQARTFELTHDTVLFPPLIQRTTVVLRDEGRGRKALVRREGDGWAVPRELERLLELHRTQDLGWVGLQMDAQTDGAVQSVRRGKVGPFWFQGTDMPDTVAKGLARHPGNLVGAFDSESWSKGKKSTPKRVLEEAAGVGTRFAVELGWTPSAERKVVATSPELARELESAALSDGRPVSILSL